MKKYFLRFRSALSCLLLFILFAGFCLAQIKPTTVKCEMDFDEAGEEENLVDGYVAGLTARAELPVQRLIKEE